jgi:hypothetical protein
MSFGLIGGSSFGRPNMGWSNSSNFSKNNRRATDNRGGRSGGRMGGKNFHQVAPTPGITHDNFRGPKDRVNYGMRDVSMSAKGSLSENSKATRLKSFKRGGKSKSMSKMDFGKGRGKYSSGGGGGRIGNDSKSSFSFDRHVNTGISQNQHPVTQDVMGGGAHLQSLELSHSSYDSTKLHVKNISLRPTGYNLPNSDVARFFETRVFPAYRTLLQESVNYKIDINPTEWQQWFFNLQEALNLWFYVDSVMNYYINNPAGNEAMSELRARISPTSLSLHDQLGQVLQTKVVDPSIVTLIRWLHDTYQCSSNNPEASLIKFSYESVISDDSSELENLLEGSINNLANIDLLKVGVLMKKAKPEWLINLNSYDGKAKYDENYLTFWANIPERFVSGTAEYMKPFVKMTSTNFEDKAQFGIYGNDYSQLLSGLTCFNYSQDGKVTQSADTDTVVTGFIQPKILNQTGINTSNLRWDSLNSGFVPAGSGSTQVERIEAMMASPSNVVIQFKPDTTPGNWTTTDLWPYTPLKPQCQEPITMSIESTQQDFNTAMKQLFNWTAL